MNTSFSKLRKSISLLSIGALLSTLVVVSPVSAALPAELAAWGPDAVAAADAYLDADKQSMAGNMATKFETAKILATALELEEVMLNPFPFTDVPEWARGYVGALVQEGIVSGASATVFASMPTVARAELVVMLDRAGLLEGGTMTLTAAQEAEVMAAPAYAQAAFRKALATGTVMQVRATDGATKLEVAIMVYRATDGAGAIETPGTPGGSNNNGPLDGEETSIEDITLSDAQDDTLLEGASEAVVAELEFDVEEGDAEFERADIIFDGTGNDEDQPWRVFSTVYLLDSEENVVAEMDVDSKSDWTETDTDDIYRVRMSGLGEVVRQDSSATYYIAVDVVNSVDGAETPGDADWTVSIEDDGLRFVDGDGVYTFETTADTAEFSIEEEGADDEFKVRASSNDPEAAVLLVEDDKKSTDQTVFIFEVEADDKSGEVEVEELTLDITVTDPTGGETTATIADVIDEVTVNVGDDSYDFDSVTSAADVIDGDTLGDESDTASYVFEFDTEEFALEAGDKQEVEVTVTFKSQAGYDNGTKVQVSADSADFDVVSVDTGKSVTDLTGSATSEEHQLFTFAVQAKELAQSYKEGNDTNTLGTFTLEFELTAIGEDVYIRADDIDQDDTDDDLGFNVTLSGAGATETVDIDSDAQEVASGTYYKVAEGSTETFTITAVADNTGAGTAGLYQLLLDSVFVDMDSTAGDEVLVDLSDQDIETNKYYVAT